MNQGCKLMEYRCQSHHRKLECEDVCTCCLYGINNLKDHKIKLPFSCFPSGCFASSVLIDHEHKSQENGMNVIEVLLGLSKN